MAQGKLEHEAAAIKVGLPPRPFLYTLDQISVLLSIELSDFQKSYIYYENRSIGVRQRYLLAARNIAHPEDKPDWRVSERELVRWMRYMGYKYYERGYVE